jgi:hypothetical protein
MKDERQEVMDLIYQEGQIEVYQAGGNLNTFRVLEGNCLKFKERKVKGFGQGYDYIDSIGILGKLTDSRFVMGLGNACICIPGHSSFYEGCINSLNYPKLNYRSTHEIYIVTSLNEVEKGFLKVPVPIRNRFEILDL